MSLKILRALSRFEDVDDLPKETVTSILINQALRARMRVEPDVDKQIVLVRDVIIEDAAAIRDALEREKARAAELASELEQLKAEKGKVEVAAGVVEAAELRSIAIEADLERERSASKLLAERLASLEAALASEHRQRDDERSRVARRRTRSWAVVLGVILFLVLAIAAWFGARLRPAWLSNSKARFLAGAFVTVVWSTVVLVFGRRSEHVRM
jgi:hypothetical protein